jgi:hypothetical protein
MSRSQKPPIQFEELERKGEGKIHVPPTWRLLYRPCDHPSSVQPIYCRVDSLPRDGVQWRGWRCAVYTGCHGSCGCESLRVRSRSACPSRVLSLIVGQVNATRDQLQVRDVPLFTQPSAVSHAEQSCSIQDFPVAHQLLYYPLFLFKAPTSMERSFLSGIPFVWRRGANIAG